MFRENSETQTALATNFAIKKLIKTLTDFQKHLFTCHESYQRQDFCEVKYEIRKSNIFTTSHGIPKIPGGNSREFLNYRQEFPGISTIQFYLIDS